MYKNMFFNYYLLCFLEYNRDRSQIKKMENYDEKNDISTNKYGTVTRWEC